MDPPKDRKGRKGGEGSDDARPSRREQYQDDGEYPLPEIDDGMHIIDGLMQVGPIASVGMGLGPVSWLEIQAWHTATCSSLAPHELQLIRSLSSDYLQSYDKARARDCPSPMLMRTKTAEDAKALQVKIKNVLRG
jgi:hypothetical protein